jgi:hypothetical protein
MVRNGSAQTPPAQGMGASSMTLTRLQRFSGEIGKSGRYSSMKVAVLLGF